MKKVTLIIAFLVLVLLAGLMFMQSKKVTAPSAPVLSFEDCEKAGYLVMEMYPRQCKTPDGKTFAEELSGTFTYSNASSDKIVVDLPYPNAVTGKEFSVLGKARGGWYFEASFPVEVVDQNGNQIAMTIGKAQSDWMVEDFVPFKADIVITNGYTGPATLILRKDNPSGEAQYDGSVSFPIVISY